MKVISTIENERKLKRIKLTQSFYEKKLANAKNKDIEITNKDFKIEMYTKKINELQEKAAELKYLINKDNAKISLQHSEKTLNSLKTYQKNQQELDEVKKSFNDKKKEDEANKIFSQLVESGALSDKHNITESTVAELKKIAKIDEDIKGELKEIKENQIDEQDTSIHKTSPEIVKEPLKKAIKSPAKLAPSVSTLGTLAGLGIGAGLLYKLLNDYLDKHGEELFKKFVPKDIADAVEYFNNLPKETKPKALQLATKTTVTGIKAASTTKKIVKTAITKKATKISAKKATKKIVKAEIKSKKKPGAVKQVIKKVMPKKITAKKASVKVGGVIFTRLVKETDEQLEKRIAGVLLEKAALKSGGKKIPGISIAAGSGFAYIEWKNGNYTAAAGEMLSGIAAMFPGVGTGISFVIDLMLVWNQVDRIMEDIRVAEAREQTRKANRKAGIQTILKVNAKKKLQSKVQEYAGKDEKTIAIKKKLSDDRKNITDYLIAGNKTPEKTKELLEELAASNKALSDRMDEITIKMNSGLDAKSLLERAKKKYTDENSEAMFTLRKEQTRLLNQLSDAGTPDIEHGYNQAMYDAIYKNIAKNAKAIGDLEAKTDYQAKSYVEKIKAPELAAATTQYDRSVNGNTISKMSGDKGIANTSYKNSGDVSTVKGGLKTFVNAILGIVGHPYIWGGTSLTSGGDCSGVVYAALNKAGYKIGRTTAAGFWKSSKGQRVNKLKDLKVGDTPVFGRNHGKGRIHHIATVTGFKNGVPVITHAKGRKYGSLTEVMSPYYQGQFVGAKRWFSGGQSSSKRIKKVSSAKIGDKGLTKVANTAKTKSAKEHNIDNKNDTHKKKNTHTPKINKERKENSVQRSSQYLAKKTSEFYKNIGADMPIKSVNKSINDYKGTGINNKQEHEPAIMDSFGQAPVII